MSEPMTPEEYASKGTRCPVCRQNDLVGESIDIDDGLAMQPMRCNDCGTTWTDIYTLTGYQDLEVDGPSQADQPRLLRELLMDQNATDLLQYPDVADALLQVPSIQARILQSWQEEQQLAAEEEEEARLDENPYEHASSFSGCAADCPACAWEAEHA